MTSYTSIDPDFEAETVQLLLSSSTEGTTEPHKEYLSFPCLYNKCMSKSEVGISSCIFVFVSLDVFGFPRDFLTESAASSSLSYNFSSLRRSITDVLVRYGVQETL